MPVNMRQRLRLAQVRLHEDVFSRGLRAEVEELERRVEIAEQRGPSPARTGATKRSSLSTKPASRNAVASVGPPSSRSDWTPSAASARELVRERAAAQLELRALRQRAAPEREPARLAASAPTSRASSRGASARTVPIPTATASDAARSSCTRRRDSSPETQRRPGTVTRPSSVTAALYVTNGRPSDFQTRHASFCRRAARSSRSSTSMPAARRRSRPRPSTTGFGSRAPTTTRATPGVDDRVGAGRRAAVVRARLERHVERRTARRVARLLERDRLGVADAVVLVPALADDLAVAHDDRADDRMMIAGLPAPALGELERALVEGSREILDEAAIGARPDPRDRRSPSRRRAATRRRRAPRRSSRRRSRRRPGRRHARAARRAGARSARPLPA